MANIALTVNEDGSALLDLSGGGEIRQSISLEDVGDGPPALESLVLHFDFYGRLAKIEVTDSATSVLPPGRTTKLAPGRLPQLNARAGAEANPVSKTAASAKT